MHYSRYCRSRRRLRPCVFINKCTNISWFFQSGVSRNSLRKSDTTTTSVRQRGRPLLDPEALTCLIVLLFIDESRLQTQRLHKVLRTRRRTTGSCSHSSPSSIAQPSAAHRLPLASRRQQTMRQASMVMTTQRKQWQHRTVRRKHWLSWTTQEAVVQPHSARWPTSAHPTGCRWVWTRRWDVAPVCSSCSPPRVRSASARRASDRTLQWLFTRKRRPWFVVTCSTRSSRYPRVSPPTSCRSEITRRKTALPTRDRDRAATRRRTPRHSTSGISSWSSTVSPVGAMGQLMGMFWRALRSFDQESNFCMNN